MVVDDFLVGIEYHRDGLWHYAYYLTHSATNAEDVVQEAIQKAITNRDQFDTSTGLDGLKAWLRRIVKSEAAYYGRKVSTRKKKETSWDKPLNSAEHGDDPGWIGKTVEDLASIQAYERSYEELADEIQHESYLDQARHRWAVANLTHPQEECLLDHLLDTKQEETAERLGISQQMVSQHLKAAIAKLRKCSMEDYVPGDALLDEDVLPPLN